MSYNRSPYRTRGRSFGYTHGYQWQSHQNPIRNQEVGVYNTTLSELPPRFRTRFLEEAKEQILSSGQVLEYGSNLKRKNCNSSENDMPTTSNSKQSHNSKYSFEKNTKHQFHCSNNSDIVKNVIPSENDKKQFNKSNQLATGYSENSRKHDEDYCNSEFDILLPKEHLGKDRKHLEKAQNSYKNIKEQHPVSYSGGHSPSLDCKKNKVYPRTTSCSDYRIKNEMVYEEATRVGYNKSETNSGKRNEIDYSAVNNDKKFLKNENHFETINKPKPYSEEQICDLNYDSLKVNNCDNQKYKKCDSSFRATSTVRTQTRNFQDNSSDRTKLNNFHSQKYSNEGKKYEDKRGIMQTKSYVRVVEVDKTVPGYFGSSSLRECHKAEASKLLSQENKFYRNPAKETQLLNKVEPNSIYKGNATKERNYNHQNNQILKIERFSHKPSSNSSNRKINSYTPDIDRGKYKERCMNTDFRNHRGNMETSTVSGSRINEYTYSGFQLNNNQRQRKANINVINQCNEQKVENVPRYENENKFTDVKQSQNSDIKHMKIEVSDKVEDVKYWENLLKTYLHHEKFKIEVACTYTQTLSIVFYNNKEAKEGNLKLRKMKGKDIENPHIIHVSSIKAWQNENIRYKNVKGKVLDDCWEYINRQQYRCMSEHEEKIAAVKNELKTTNNQLLSANDTDTKKLKNEKTVVEGKLKELEEIKNVFLKYVEKTRECLNNIHSDNKMLQQIKNLKKNLSRECNCLKNCLPIYSKKNEILRMIHKNQVCVIIAETGSGKSTQLVQYLWQEGFAKNGIIVCTQPRKIAAISITTYVSGQIGTAVGDIIGYQAGISKKIGKSTKIVYMTDYTLLGKCLKNKNLKGYSCIVVDEAHERTLYTDLLIGMIKKCLIHRPDIRVVITSATIDPGVFMNYFSLKSGAIMAVPGRLYPVNVIWNELDAYIGWNYVEASAKLAYEVHNENKDKGGILVFLTSPYETEEAINIFKKLHSNESKNQILPILLCLHGKQDMNDQLQIFVPIPKGNRKIIFATNSAETSITVPGIKYVIDSGMVKEMQYSAQKNRSELVVGFVNQSSAEQRKGRAGRTQPGICYRLYSKENYMKDMEKRVMPDILKVSIQQALLKILEFGIQPEEFDFVESPSVESIKSAMNALEYLGAVENKTLTQLGRQMAKLPLEPQLAKLVLRGVSEEIGYETVVLAALASVSGKVFFRTEENKTEADEHKMKFCQEQGDFSTFLEVFKNWNKVPKDDKTQWCVENCINAKAMRGAHQIIMELLHVLSNDLSIQIKKRFNEVKFNSKCQKILLECFSENLCVFSGHRKTGYLSPFQQGSFFIHPSSSVCYLRDRMHLFVVYTTVLKTSRQFLLNVTPIEETTIVKAHQNGEFPFQLDMLKRLQILPIRIWPIGETILVREILGRQGYKLHDIEDQIKKFTKTDSFHIDVSVEHGEILIYIEEHHHDFVARLFNCTVQEARCKMEKEEEIHRIANCASSSFILGSGGIVHDIILPGEFRELLIDNHKSSNISDVISKLKKYGIVQNYQEISSRDKSQLIVTYKTTSSAHRALQELREQGNFDVDSKVSFSKVIEKTLPLFRVQVSWCRLACQGTGWVTFYSSEDCIGASGILTSTPIFINGKHIIISPTRKNDKELYIKNLPETIDSNEIMNVLMENIPQYLKIQNVTLVREKYHKSSENEIITAKKQLQQLFGKYTPSSKLVIDLKSPNPKDIMWTALVYFENFEDGENAVSSLQGKAKLKDFLLVIKPILKSTLSCKFNIYKAVEKELHSKVKHFKSVSLCSEFDIKSNSEKEAVQIAFSCTNISNLNKVRQDIKKLIEGHCILCSGNSKLVKLLSKSGQLFLKQIERTTKTVITTDYLKKAIFIFGLEKSCSIAKREIMCYVAGSSISQSKVFDLTLPNIPLGFLRELYKIYGFNLYGLIEECQLKAAEVNLIDHKLSFEGSEKTIAKAEKLLQNLCAELHSKSKDKKPTTEDQESCPICFDTIVYDFYRLENCGHAYCKPCLLLQIEAKTIPLVCSEKDCEKLFFIEDMRKLLYGHEELKQEFCNAALRHFVNKNNEVYYCPSPDCPMVYRASLKDTQFHCPICENDVCTCCHDLYHHGMTCEMYQQSKTDEDYSLKCWLQKDSSNRKICPKCFSALEKIGGCNHILCASCKIHICWQCLRTFQSSEEVYEHLPFCESK